jgi:predicted RNA-binding Zn-ribbon protein involved in translation (DUF1610 family)
MGEPVSAEAILFACPACAAWPMAVTTRKSWFPRSTLSFICPKCHFRADDADLQKARSVKRERPA